MTAMMVLHRICERLGRLLEKRGLLCRDAEQSYLTFDYDDEDVINDLVGSASKEPHILTL